MSKMDYSIKYCYTNHHAKMMMKYPPSKRFFLLYQSKANLMDLIRILITFVDRKCNQGQLLLPSKKKKHMFTIRRIWHSISNLKVVKLGQISESTHFWCCPVFIPNLYYTCIIHVFDFMKMGRIENTLLHLATFWHNLGQKLCQVNMGYILLFFYSSYFVFFIQVYPSMFFFIPQKYIPFWARTTF